MAYTILIVDDEPFQLLVLRELFEMHGCRVIEATDGDEAFKIAQAEKPDLIVMDINMPKMQGDTAIHVLRETVETAGIGIIICSGNDKEKVERSVTFGPKLKYHEKPVNLNRLWETSAELLGAKPD